MFIVLKALPRNRYSPKSGEPTEIAKHKAKGKLVEVASKTRPGNRKGKRRITNFNRKLAKRVEKCRKEEGSWE
jgi:hypothetical protein